MVELGSIKQRKMKSSGKTNGTSKNSMFLTEAVQNDAENNSEFYSNGSKLDSIVQINN